MFLLGLMVGVFLTMLISRNDYDPADYCDNDCRTCGYTDNCPFFEGKEKC